MGRGHGREERVMAGTGSKMEPPAERLKSALAELLREAGVDDPAVSRRALVALGEWARESPLLSHAAAQALMALSGA